MTTFANSPRLIRGGIVLVDPDQRPGHARHRAAVQPGHADADAAAAGGGGRRRPIGEALRLEGAADRDDQARRRDRRDRPARVSRPESDRRRARASRRSSPRSRRSSIPRARQLIANNAAGNAGRSRSCRWRRRWRCSCGASSAWCRCASPTSASPRRRSMRSSIRSAPRSASRPARPVGRRPRLRQQGRRALHGLPAEQGAAGAERVGGALRGARTDGDSMTRATSFPPKPLHHDIATADARAPRRPHHRLSAPPLRATAGELRAPAEHVRERATGSTSSRRATSAIPNSSGASPTPTAPSAPDELTDAVGRTAARHAAGRHGRGRDGE